MVTFGIKDIFHLFDKNIHTKLKSRNQAIHHSRHSNRVLVHMISEQRRRDSSPNYKAWLEEQAVLEQFKATEEKRLAMQRHQIWEAENEAALLRWREQQSRLAHAKAEKFKREVSLPHCRRLFLYLINRSNK